MTVRLMNELFGNIIMTQRKIISYAFINQHHPIGICTIGTSRVTIEGVHQEDSFFMNNYSINEPHIDKKSIFIKNIYILFYTNTVNDRL